MRKVSKGSSTVLSITAVFSVLLSDQISKFVVVKSLNVGESIGMLPFFNIVRVENSGITFGLLNGALPSYVLMLISLLVIASLCVWIKSNQSYRFPGSLVIGGAIGNLVDRIIYGAVIDFLDFHLLIYHWPAFNIADSAIVIGAAAMFLISYGEEKK